jgi:hypothetical protein
MPLFRKASLRRRSQQRFAKKKFWLFCEGKNTEPLYFSALNDACRETLVEVKSIGAVGDPGRISEVAAKKLVDLGLHGKRRAALNSYETGDEVWAVFDRDEHERFDEAIKRCGEAGVFVARSNPCFEIWLILHFTDFHRPDDRHAVQKELHKHCPEVIPPFLEGVWRRTHPEDCTSICRLSF